MSMRIIRRQIFDMIKNHKGTVVLLAVMQMLVIFCVLFVTGVFFNNYKMLNEDDYTTLYMYIDFTVGEYVEFNEVEGVLTGVFENFSVPVKEVSCGDNRYDEEDGSVLGICTFFSWEKGKYEYSSSLNKAFTYQIQQGSGRLFNEEEMNQEDLLCVTRSFDEDVIEIDGVTLNSLGKLYEITEDMGQLLLVTPPTMRNFNIDYATINIYHLITDEDYEYIENALNQVVPGRYSITWNKEKDGERDMMLRTVIMACSFIIIVMVGVMMSLYHNLISRNRYSIGIWRLLGCSHIKATLIYVLQITTIMIPSLICGALLFLVMKDKWLVKIYPYMNNLYSFGNVALIYFIISLIIMVAVSVVAYRKTDEKIRGLIG